MSNPQKNKGNRFERKIVEICELHDIPAKRSYASDGRSLGMHSEVDVLINNDIKVQAKCRKKIAAHMQPNENVDVQIIKQNRGPVLVVQELNDWLLMLKESKNG
jgi:hypothetical protein